jgi:hypothetical protein
MYIDIEINALELHISPMNISKHLITIKACITKDITETLKYVIEDSTAIIPNSINSTIIANEILIANRALTRLLI